MTPLSFARIPPPLPRSSWKMLVTLSSLPDFGLRFAPISTGTLGFSRLARRSILIVVCTLADSLDEPFASRASTGRSLFRIASTASDWNVSCRAGYLPPTGFRRPFHGAPEPHPTFRNRVRSRCAPLKCGTVGSYPHCCTFNLPPLQLQGASPWVDGSWAEPSSSVVVGAISDRCSGTTVARDFESQLFYSVRVITVFISFLRIPLTISIKRIAPL